MSADTASPPADEPLAAHPDAPPATHPATHPAERPLPSRRPAGPERAWHNQYLPTLFDRLSDDAPEQRTEAPADYVPTRAGLRRIVQRDLTYLLNAVNQHDRLDPDRHAAVASSTVNYGLPPLAGRYLSDRKWGELEKMIRRAILDFEPRLLPHTVAVRPLAGDDGQARYNVLLFEITGSLYMEPYPVEFTVQSAVDLETSRMTLRSP